MELDPLLTPDAILPGALPWFLEEPRSYPKAAPLVALAQHILATDPGATVHALDALRVYAWPDDGPHVRPGLGVWWHGRCVLLATTEGQVWLYTPSDDWQDVLQTLAGASIPPMLAPARGFLPTDEERAQCAPPMWSPGWTGNTSTQSHVFDRPQTQQDVIDASTAAFQARRLP